MDNESSQTSIKKSTAIKKKYNKPTINNLTKESSCVLGKKVKNSKHNGKARTAPTNTKGKKAKCSSSNKGVRKKFESPQMKTTSTQTIEKYPEIEEMSLCETRNIPCKFFYLGVMCPEKEECKYMHNGPLDQEQMNVLFGITYDNLSDHKRDVLYFCEIRNIIKDRLVEVQKNLQKKLDAPLTILQNKPSKKSIIVDDMNEQASSEYHNCLISGPSTITTSLDTNELNMTKEIPEQLTKQNDENDSMLVIYSNINNIVTENVEQFLQNVQTSNLTTTIKHECLKQLHDLLQYQLKKIMQQIQINNNNIDVISESSVNFAELAFPISELNNSNENLNLNDSLSVSKQDMDSKCNECDKFNNSGNNNVGSNNIQYVNCAAPDIFIADADCIDNFPGVVTHSVTYENESNNHKNLDDNDKTQGHSENIIHVSLSPRDLQIVEIIEHTLDTEQCTPNEKGGIIGNTSAAFIEALNSTLCEKNESSIHTEAFVNIDDNCKKFLKDREENSLKDLMTLIGSSHDKKLQMNQLEVLKRTRGITVRTNDPRIYNAMKEDSVYNNLMKNMDKNVIAESTPISSPVYVDTIANPLPIHNTQLPMHCKINNYAPEINGQQNYSNITYKLWEIDIPTKETDTLLLNIDKIQAMSYVDPRLHKQLKSATLSTTYSSSPEIVQAPSSFVKQQSQGNKKNDKHMEISHDVTPNKEDIVDIWKLQNPNMTLYGRLNGSSWYRGLLTSAKIKVNRFILQLVRAINNFHRERLVNPNIVFDIFKLDDANELLDVMKNLRVYVDKNGIINKKRYVSMHRNRLGINKIARSNAYKYIAEHRTTSGRNMLPISSPLFNSIQNDCNNSNSSINLVTTNTSNSSLIVVNESLKRRKMGNFSSRGSLYNRTDKGYSRSYRYTTNAKRRLLATE